MISGRYVKTFAEASHALPEGMHMNADYPFMLPRIKSLDGRKMVILGYGGTEASVEIKRKRVGERAYIEQSSTFERIYRRPPQRFELHPFKDDKTPAIGAAPS